MHVKIVPRKEFLESLPINVASLFLENKPKYKKEIRLKNKKATKVLTEGRKTIVKLWDTNIVEFTDSIVILNSGGYRTATTRRRMNQASREFGLGFNVYQEDFSWYVNTEHFKALPFKDGMSIGRTTLPEVERG